MLPSRRSITCCFSFAILGLLFSGCGDSKAPRDTTPLDSVSQSNDDLAIAIYAELSEEYGEDENLFFSPMSVSSALMLAYEGARGETQEAFGEVLRLPADGREAAHAGFAKVLDRLDGAGGKYELSVANGLWGDQAFAFEQSFLDPLNKHYDAQLASVDFRGDPNKQRQMINAWVSDQTNQRINHLLPPESVNELTRLVLANAIYFKAKWAWPFYKYQTRDRTFYAIQDGTTKAIKVPTMRQSMMLARHGQFEGYAAVELGYRSADLSMFVLLPDERDGLAKLEAKLTSKRIADTIDGVKEKYVNIWLPKWEQTLAYSLREPLSNLGLDVAFGDDADFTGMHAADQDAELRLGGVYHKAFISVDELGTEAAAATADVVADAAEEGDYQPPPSVDFKADHPFLYLIRDNQSGAILFMGRLTDPS